MNTYEVQTRSETQGIHLFPTLEAVMAYAEGDPSVWKISFSLPSGERVRLVRNNAYRALGTGNPVWVYEPIVLP